MRKQTLSEGEAGGWLGGGGITSLRDNNTLVYGAGRILAGCVLAFFRITFCNSSLLHGRFQMADKE